MSGLFGGFRHFVQRRAIYLPAAPFAADAANTGHTGLLTLRLDTRSLLNQRTNQFRLQFRQTEALVERVLGQHDMIINSSRVEQCRREKLNGLQKKANPLITMGFSPRHPSTSILTLNSLMASLCKFSDERVVRGDVMLSLEWSNKGFRHKLQPGWDKAKDRFKLQIVPGMIGWRKRGETYLDRRPFPWASESFAHIAFHCEHRRQRRSSTGRAKRPSLAYWPAANKLDLREGKRCRPSGWPIWRSPSDWRFPPLHCRNRKRVPVLRREHPACWSGPVGPKTRKGRRFVVTVSRLADWFINHLPDQLALWSRGRFCRRACTSIVSSGRVSLWQSILQALVFGLRGPTGAGSYCDGQRSAECAPIRQQCHSSRPLNSEFSLM